MKFTTQANGFIIVLILLILFVVFVKCMCVAKEYWWFGTKKEEEEEEDDNGLDESTAFGSGDRGWDGKPWVYNGNNQNVKDWIYIINKRFKTPPKPKSCMEINTNIHGYFADLVNMMNSESFRKDSTSEITDIMNNAQYEIATSIDPSWKNKYTKDTLPDYFPTTPETEFYGLNKPFEMLTDENNVNPLINELGCKKVVIPTTFAPVYIPTSTDAQITTARELITTVKKFDANNVNCADAALTFMMLTILVDEPGVGRDHPDVGRVNWVPDIVRLSTKCADNPVFLEDEDEDEG